VELENASLAASAVDRTLNRANSSARLAACYDFLEERQKAREWKEFLWRLDYPDATKETFTRVAARVQERCDQPGRLVLL
jgi:DNA/RNA-binding domain of Phe-tRNA-synthetase-like protein